VAAADGNHRLWRIGLLAVLLIGAGLRTYSAVTEAIEVDELFTRDVTSHSIRAGVAMVLDDRYHPPLYYVLAKILSPISGTSPEGLRLLSVLSGVVLVVAVAFVARMLLADVPLALLAALLVGVSDWQILVSHYARSYSLFDLLVFLMGASLWQACRQPGGARPWAAFVIAGAAVVNTNYLGWLYLASTLPAVALCGTRAVRRWLAACGVVVASFLPWLLLLTWYAHRKGGFASKVASLGFRQGRGALVNAFAQLNGLPAQTWWAIALTLLLGGSLAGLAIVAAWRRPRDVAAKTEGVGVLVMGCLAVFPPLVLWLITRPPMNLPLWGFRQLTPSIAPWIVVVCAGVAALARGKRLLQGALALILVAFQGVTTATNTVCGRFVPFEKMVRLFAERPAASPTVYVQGWPPWQALLEYYLRGSGSVATLPDDERTLPHSFWLVYRPADEAGSRRVAALLAGHWLVRCRQDFEKRGGDRGVVRALLLSKQVATDESATTAKRG
jgi:4-amino-4-deoxy-L-arabinose transferase-like glycosyltransferase